MQHNMVQNQINLYNFRLRFIAIHLDDVSPPVPWATSASATF